MDAGATAGRQARDGAAVIEAIFPEEADDAERAAPRVTAADRGAITVLLRDDGPLSRALGRLARGQIPPLFPLLVAACVAGTLVGLGIGNGDGLEVFAPAVALLLAGPSAASPHSGRFDWLVPPTIRAIEYPFIAVIGFDHGAPRPLILALLAVIALHHCDVAQRARVRLAPPEWVMRAGLGWDGRMLIVAAAALAHAVTADFVVLSLYLGVTFGAEAVTTWLHTARADGHVPGPED
jgi:hypothetical protein